MSVSRLTSDSDYAAVVAASAKTLHVIHFMAEWYEPCQAMATVFRALSDRHGSLLKFCDVDAETVPDVSMALGIESVPTFIFVKGGKVVDRLQGANAMELSTKVSALANIEQVTVSSVKANQGSGGNTVARIEALLQQHPVLLFMKGSQQQPRCGFSARIVQLLESNHIQFATFDILEDEDIRAGVKVYGDFPTYPQLWVQRDGGKSTLIGGLDICTELAEEGELQTIIASSQRQGKEDIHSRLDALVVASPVMLFMKGSPAEPECGFSAKIVKLLDSLHVKYGYFNILSDEEVRAQLKIKGNWPTYPQVWAGGVLLGGLDVVTQMAEDGDLLDALPKEAYC